MKRILLIIAGVAVLALLAINANTSEATPSPKAGLNKGAHINVNVNVRGSRAWRSYCYYPAYRCYLFFDPITRQWFFYSDRLHQFLPISLISAYPPLANGANLLPPGGIPGTPGVGPGAGPIGTPTTGSPALPPGATPIPNNPTQPVTPTVP